MKRIHLILLLIGWSIALSHADNQIPQPNDLNLVEEPRLLQAIESAQKAVEKAPGKAAVWGQLGKVYHIHGWEAEAAQCYRRAAEIDPTEFRWLYYLGMITHKTDPQAAEVVLAQAIRLDPEYPPAHVYYAYALRRLGRFEGAKRHLERAKALDPQNPYPDLWLGELALAAKQFESARDHLRRALTLNPEQSEAHAGLAQVALVLGDREAANRHAQAARKPTAHAEMRDPLWWEVLKEGVTASLYAARGRRYLLEGDFAHAVAELEVLISGAQKDPEVWLNYGVALLFTERYGEAIVALESALAVLRDNEGKKSKNPEGMADLKTESYYNLGLVYYRTGRMEKAIAACQKAIQLEPDFANAYGSLGMVYWETGRHDEAILQYKKAIEIAPMNVEFHQDLAKIYWQKEMYDEAAATYQIVVTHNPSDGDARYRLGLVLLGNGKYDEAVSCFQKVLEINPNNMLAHGALGVTYSKLGRRQAAIEEFQAVLRLDPQNQNARDMLKQLSR